VACQLERYPEVKGSVLPECPLRQKNVTVTFKE